MAETSAALRFSPFSSLSSFARVKDSSFSSFSAAFPPNSHPCPSRLLRVPAKLSSNSSNSLPDDLFGFFPWSNDSEIEWVTEERVTLFTCDGLIQIGGSMVPRRITSSNKKQGRSKTTQRFQRFQESDYMDTEQGLCLGALFDIAATNGLDMGRRLCIFGFCRSIEMLSDVVEDTVLEHGGEVKWFHTQKRRLWLALVAGLEARVLPTIGKSHPSRRISPLQGWSLSLLVS
ncbi:uncharacterized protein LOC126594307 isoform X2 [Malus sylvestris]|uniref:uncharacterized protein LOC126594307 isoform X2 n=1 Tax=Malus sylvestris TaxID=3752 RepID=UPI0021AD4179|nr:uncharacterized protein LOC126594307 isoform X2 [Malus sylvestris]